MAEHAEEVRLHLVDGSGVVGHSGTLSENLRIFEEMAIRRPATPGLG
jgi:hypothetical protein